MTLGRRGYETVHLVDAAPAVGGHLSWVSTLPGFGAWRRVIDWRKTQIDTRTYVGVQLNTELSYEDVLASGAEHVIFATGSRWDGSGMSAPLHAPIEGVNAESPEVCTPEQYVIDGKPMGTKVLVIDNDAYYMGSAMAQLLAERGHEVTYATYGETVGPYLRFTLEEQRTYQTLTNLGVEMIAHHLTVAAADGEATLVHIWSGRERTVPYDSIMLVTHRVSNCELHDRLQAVAGRHACKRNQVDPPDWRCAHPGDDCPVGVLGYPPRQGVRFGQPGRAQAVHPGTAARAFDRGGLPARRGVAALELSHSGGTLNERDSRV